MTAVTNASAVQAAGASQPGNLLCELARTDGLLWQVLEYARDETYQLERVSCELHQFIKKGCHPSIEGRMKHIFETCSDGDNIACRYVDQLKRELAGDSMAYATAHRILVARLRTLEIRLPLETILSSHMVHRICAKTQKCQDENFGKFWKDLHHHHFRATGFPTVGIPAETAPVGEVRTWLNTAENQTRLGQYNHPMFVDVTGYSYVPWEIRLFTGVNHLTICSVIPSFDNPIRLIPGGAFEGLVHVQALELSGLGLETLERGAFRGLMALTHLTLSQNRLTSLEHQPFLELPALRCLNLENNLLTSIPPEALAGPVALETVRLLQNPISCEEITRTREALGSVTFMGIIYQAEVDAVSTSVWFSDDDDDTPPSRPILPEPVPLFTIDQNEPLPRAFVRLLPPGTEQKLSPEDEEKLRQCAEILAKKILASIPPTIPEQILEKTKRTLKRINCTLM